MVLSTHVVLSMLVIAVAAVGADLPSLQEDIRRAETAVENIGVTYTRWGNRSCNATSGAELIQSGYIAGQDYRHGGGATNYLCLPFTPQYGSNQGGHQHQGLVYGAELEVSGPLLSNLNHENPTCSVCHVSRRVSQLMIPARTTCPPSWTREYGGYLMSSYHGHKRTKYICVDSNPDVLAGESGSTFGALLYFVEAQCGGGLKCPPYEANKVLTCVVCSR